MGAATAAKTILIATVPQAAERLRRILGADVRMPTIFEEAAQLLRDERMALAIIGVHFAESRMFELLSFARGSVANRDTPIVCVLGIRGGLSEGLIRSIASTVNAMPGCVFLNLAALADDDAGNAKVLAFVEGFLASDVAGARAAPPPPPQAS